MLSDLRLAARLLVKERGFTVAAVVVLACGIAVTNTAFTLVNGVLLRDMPFVDPDRVVELGDASYRELQDWHAAAGTFEGIAGALEQPVNVSEDSIAAERQRGAYVSAHAFTLLGARPILGRPFRAADDRADAVPVVILGHTLWRTRYRSSADVLGRTIRVNGVPSTVVGVMPEGFEFPMNARLWQPLAAMPADLRDNRSARVIDAFGRLRTGTSRQQAQADLARIDASLRLAYPANARRNAPSVAAFRSGIGAPWVAVMAAMMGAVMFVLLIACANVANLLLARSATRSREISVRMSVGATRARIVRQLLVESVLLAALGGAVAFVLTTGSVRLFWRFVTEVDDPPPFWLSFPIDGQVVAFLTAVCLGTSVLFGLAPALHTSRINIAGLLNETSGRTAGTRRTRRWTGALVVAQLTLALVLLSGAGLMMRNLLTQVTMDAGVNTSGLMRMALDLPAAVYSSPERRTAFYARLDERLKATPGATATLASAIPLAGAQSGRVLFRGRPEPPADERPIVSLMTIGPRYFETLGVAMRQGRAFDSDAGRLSRIAIVNQRFVDLYLRDGNPLAASIRLDSTGDWLTIVGVVDNLRQRSTAGGAFDPVVYLPLDANPIARINILVRSDLPLTTIASTIRAHVTAIDADLAVWNVRTVDEDLALSRWPQRLFGSLFAIFAVVAVVLAAVGLYAVTACSVAQRTQEIGIRIALGAPARQVWWIVTRGAMRQMTTGLVLGLLGAVAVARVLPALLTGTARADPLTLVSVALVLLAVGFAAAALPARRATRLDPVATLRAD
jgi:predicted permease